MRTFGTIILVAVSLALEGCGYEADEETYRVLPELAEAAPQVETLDTVQLAALLEEGSVRLIDVRRDDEVAEGMIPGAEHIVLDEFDPATLDMSDGREVVLYCRSGRRSGIAADRLAAHTGQTARHLEGGIIAWREAELPTASLQ